MEYNRAQDEAAQKRRDARRPKAGDVFTHKSYLDDRRQPALMKVTRVTETTVYFTYADSPTNKGAFRLDRSVWIERYGSNG